MLKGALGDEVSLVGAYRFDDPAGEVGIECHLIAGLTGAVAHLPVVYRSAPIEGSDDVFVGTVDHSALGQRWVYEACGDPIYVRELVRAILVGGTQVEMYVDTEGGRIVREPTATVLGTGEPGAVLPPIDAVSVASNGTDSVIQAGALEIVVHHVLAVPSYMATLDTARALNGTWSDQAAELAFIRASGS